MDHDVPIVIRARRSDDTPAVMATMRSDLAHLNRHSDWTEIVEAQAGPLSGAPALVALAAVASSEAAGWRRSNLVGSP